MAAKAFDLKQVRVLAGPLKHAMDLNAAYLLKLDPDRLLSRFREYAGLTPKAANYEGWEAMGISGHTLGHYLSGCSLMYASTGEPAFLERVQYVVDELELCQKAHGNGYVSGIPRGKELFEEVRTGDIRSQGFDLNGGWVPLYTMHKLFAGLRDAYRHAENNKALDIEVRLGEWLESVFEPLSDEQVQRVLHCEFGGMNEVLSDLAADSGEERFLRLAEKFYHGEVLDDLAGGRDSLSGRHANTQIPKIIGAARQFETTGKPVYADIARYFWDRVVHHHSYVIGGNSYNEHFGDAGRLNDRLGEGTCETCNTYNMLKLTRHMFQWDAEAAYADYYERAMFNHILASQQPEDGRVCYFVSLEMGGRKTFNTQFDSFTCCVGSGMESHALYGSALYFHSEEAIYVNQFVPSSVDWREKKVKLTQETAFPAEGRGRISVDADEPLPFTLKLRCPYWAERGMTIRVNGCPVETLVKPTSYIDIHREWKSGDVVEYDIPMGLRTETMPDNEKRIAFLYGPLVLAGDLGPAGPADLADAADRMLAPVILGNPADVTLNLVPVPGKTNRFLMKNIGLNGEWELRPFYEMYDRNYTVYWDLFSPEDWVRTEAQYRGALEANLRLEQRTVDFVQPAEMQPERDHRFEGEHVGLGSIYNRKYRDSWPNGWFSFVMRVLPDEPVDLAVTYIKGPSLDDFDIIVGGLPLVDGKLESEEMGKFETYIYTLPQEAVQGRSEVTIKFAAHKGRKIARVAGLRTVRKN